jgi:hypothetical protein
VQDALGVRVSTRYGLEIVHVTRGMDDFTLRAMDMARRTLDSARRIEDSTRGIDDSSRGIDGFTRRMLDITRRIEDSTRDIADLKGGIADALRHAAHPIPTARLKKSSAPPAEGARVPHLK